VHTAWFECMVDVPIEHGEIVANFLIDHGAPGLQSEEGGGITRLTAYYCAPPPVDALVRFCASLGCPLRGNDSIRVRRVPHEDWAENWKAHFHAQALGERLYICPPWDCVAPAGRLAVVIDPGMAFGTGHHASTRGCLLLLEHALGDRRMARALDVGTGSGVLAIALAKLGLTEVWAIDIDADACTIAEANAAQNGVEARVHIRHSLHEVSGTFEVLCANLFAHLLQQMAPELADLVTPGGVFICSGFLSTDEHAVCRAYEVRGLHVTRRLEEESWVTLALQRSPER
jgi:ribosomal protein L11 methyltransferase